MPGLVSPCRCNSRYGGELAVIRTVLWCPERQIIAQKRAPAHSLRGARVGQRDRQRAAVMGRIAMGSGAGARAWPAFWPRGLVSTVGGRGRGLERHQEIMASLETPC